MCGKGAVRFCSDRFRRLPAVGRRWVVDVLVQAVSGTTADEDIDSGSGGHHLILTVQVPVKKNTLTSSIPDW